MNTFSIALLSLLAVVVITGCGGGAGALTMPVSFAGNWEGTWASSRVNAGGVFLASISQNGASISGTAAFSGSPCFVGLQLSGNVSGGSFAFTGSSGGIPRVTVSGSVSGNAMSGNYTVLASGTPCDGDRGGVNAAKR
jgi:hypothetical protein